MKTVVVNRMSWHYKLAEWGSFDSYSDQDLCTYTRTVMGGFLLMLIVGGLIGFASMAVGDFIGWVAAGFMNGFARPEFLAGMVLFVGVCAMMFFLLRGVLVTAEKSEFLSQAYTSLRDKVCYRLEVK